MYKYEFCAIEDNMVKYLGQCDDCNKIGIKDVTAPYFVSCIKDDKIVKDLRTREDLEEWTEARQRSLWMKNPDIVPNVAFTNIPVSPSVLDPRDFVKPTHYQNYIDEYQWVDAMSRIPRFKDPIAFKAAVELQIRKYLDRNGRKDDELQELKKGLFYYMYLVMYLKNDCKPILAKDIHEIMEKFK